MFVRSSKFLLHVFSALLICIVLVSGYVVWQLSRGPISIGFLTPYVEEALTLEDSPVRVRLGDTVLAWAGFDRTLDVRALGLDLLSADGSVIASVPEVSVRFSVRALLNGLIAPTSIELLGPRLLVYRESDGQFTFNMANVELPDDGSGPDIPQILTDLLAGPDNSRQLGYLQRIDISSAYVEFEDRETGKRLTAPRVSVAFERDGEGIRAAGSVAVDIEGKPVRFQVSGILSARSGKSDFGLTFVDLAPSALAPLAPDLGFLADVAIPVNGTIALSFDRDFGLSDVGFDFDSKGGTVAIPDLYANALPLADIALRGRARDSFRSIAVEEGEFKLAGVPVSLTGTVVRRGNMAVGDFDATVRGLAADDLGNFWPESVATPAREWVVSNLRDGMVDLARVSISGTASLDTPEDFQLTDLDGRIEASGVTVDYLYPMEPARGVNAVGTFDRTGFVIDVTAGEVRNNKLESGRIVISGLDGDAKGERIDINIVIAGSVRGAFELIDQKPLQLIRRVDVDPAQASGSHRTQLIVQLPLIKDLGFTDVLVAADSRLTGFGLTKGPFGLPVSDGALSLNVNSEKMVVDGNLSLSGVPAGIAWTEWFTSKTPTRRTYQVRAILNDAARERLGFDTAPWVIGPVGIGVTYSEAGIGTVNGAAELDLTSATMAIEPFGWRKTSGAPGRAFVRFSGDRDHIRRLDRFTVAAADLAVEGDLVLRIAKDGAAGVSQVTLKRLAFGSTDIFAAAEIAPDGAVDLSLGGRQLDLRREVAALDASDESNVANPDEINAAAKTPVRVRISEAAPIATLRLGEQTSVTGLTGTLRLLGEDVREAALSGALNGNSALSLSVTDTGAARDINFVSENGGAVIDALDLTDTILGGRLELRGRAPDAPATETFVGQIDLSDFRLTKASSVSRALTMASFAGIGDAISGQGLGFRRAEVPVSVTDGVISIREAKLRGSDIGVLLTGKVDRRNDTVDLAGELAPAYTLNSLLGNIPLIGDLLTGGGDGIFVASFSVKGPLGDPEVSVNPLTVLTPGIIRRLLTGFGRDNLGTDPGAAPTGSSTQDILPPAGRN